MTTANQKYFNAALRHQVDVRRFTAGEVKETLRLLEEADRELVARLRDRLARLGPTLDFTSARYQRMLSEIRDLRQSVVDTLARRTTAQLEILVGQEAAAEQALLSRAIPIEVSFATVPVQALRAIVTEQPFQGSLLSEWFETLGAADQRALRRSIQLGLTQGESIPNIVRRVAGTRDAGYADGALAITRRNAESVVRTAVNHVSNAAREATWGANADIIAALRVTATLDGRTTPICQALDGQLAPVGDKPLPADAVALQPPEARPPFHVGCRTVMVAVIDGVGLVGDRPFVMSAERPDEREADFRSEARRTGRPIQEIRAEWAAEHIGTVPAKTTYNDWLRDQPAAFQDTVLGDKRGALFRRGGLDVQEFVDRAGNELTLTKLANRHPSAFERANVEI